jgi:hypothetical protein
MSAAPEKGGRPNGKTKSISAPSLREQARTGAGMSRQLNTAIRVVLLFAELGRLTTREREVRLEIAELLEQSRSPAADAALGKLLQRLAEAQR